ncbi:30S ribosomal protein S1, chloroplastic [Dendrobium catenatum]|uniref:30S ribosomal protein S1, chloroplastic n=1 Tax=Dendrobium catenatum TaxID=906689 RepID=A0A2I0W6Y7_9ASPA|nr:30S ribosomal protein S1, chloroplastic [Dendrobium catenatum]
MYWSSLHRLPSRTHFRSTRFSKRVGCNKQQRATRREMQCWSSSRGTTSCSTLFIPSLIPHCQARSFFFKGRKPLSKTLFPLLFPAQNPSFCHSLPLRPTPFSRVPHVPFSSDSGKETEVELLGKPSLVSIPVGEEVPASSKSVHLDDALAPFLKFFKASDFDEKDQFGEKCQEALDGEISKEEKETLGEKKRIGVEYYDPKPGDFVVGVVVSGNANKIDVNVGADMLGTMLTKEVLPFYDAELAYLCCDLGNDAEDFMVSGKIGLVKDEEAMREGKLTGRLVVEMGTVLFAEVLGRTLSGRPLLSSRRMFRRVAWHRVRQIKQLNEPIEVKIFEWNTGGLLTRIEGLRAFLPKAELMNRVNNFMDLKKNVGRKMFVSISRIDETTNVLIISEREAWVSSSIFD